MGPPEDNVPSTTNRTNKMYGLSHFLTHWVNFLKVRNIRMYRTNRLTAQND